jgi:D-alanine--poly(phosphoribitol) ligase subunit 2
MNGNGNGSVPAERVRQLIAEVLEVDAEMEDLDLIGSGLLDSLALVELLFQIEEEFHVRMPLEELDLDTVRTVRGLAAFIAASPKR